MMSEPKPIASLSSGLLARKGQARPAMRPQGFTGGYASLASGMDDLGWNDMGQMVEPEADVHAAAQRRRDHRAARGRAAGAGAAPPAEGRRIRARRYDRAPVADDRDRPPSRSRSAGCASRQQGGVHAALEPIAICVAARSALASRSAQVARSLDSFAARCRSRPRAGWRARPAAQGARRRSRCASMRIAICACGSQAR